MQLKRWIVLLTISLVLISLGIAYMLAHVYQFDFLPGAAGVLTLQFIERPLRGALFIALGIAGVAVGIVKLNQSLLAAFMRPRNGRIVQTIYDYRFGQRGPKVVVIGGGTGLSVALRGLKVRTSNLTAIVTVADDGGSSGRLRESLGVLPPGDLRNCMVALADAEPLMEDLFQYRFNGGGGLDGHSFGNLFIVAMSDVTGNFEQALKEASRVLAVRGQVLPSTLEHVTLCAEMEDASTVHGESSISASGRRISRVSLLPANPAANPEAVRAIREADLLVVGPGSLYTSILPNLLVSEIAAAVMQSEAIRVYACNVATQPGETDGYSLSDHIDALIRHLPGREDPFDHVVANGRLGLPMPPSGRVAPVHTDDRALHERGRQLVLADVVDEANPVRHDSAKLAATLVQLYYGKRGGRRVPDEDRVARLPA
jgi:uncharacterized cofD-like protein